ncbi:MAG: hypothetical protein V3V33_06925 [Candidatus Lokiarchaeia archaeon]
MKFYELYSHMMQVYLVSKLKPKEILEIGVGNKFVTDILLKDYHVKTLDINEESKPDWLIDITSFGDLNLLPNNFFDVILICEVLEHVPFEKVNKILEILKKKTKKNIIISVPNRSKYLQVHSFKYGFSERKRNFYIKIVNWILELFNNFTKLISKIQYKVINRKLKFTPDKSGEHQWELGIDKYSESLFRNLLKKYFIIVKEERIIGFPYHHFFILEK